MLYPIIITIYLLTTIAIHKFAKIKLWATENEKKAVISWFVIIFITGCLADYFATYHQIWVFPGKGVTGLRIFWLPIEEFFFFIIIPYFVLVLYKFLYKIFNK